MYNQIHPTLIKYVQQKITEDLNSKNIVGWKNELWVLDLDTKDWFLSIMSEGNSWYNQKFFKPYLGLFSISERELGKIIKDWSEKTFSLKINNVARRQSNLTYIIDGMLRSKKNKWTLNNRFGFSYEIVKKYVSLNKEHKWLVVEDFMIYS